MADSASKPPLMAITLHRPWPYAIAALGKDMENRSWLCPLDPGSLLAIHAGKKWDEDGADWIRKAIWDELPGPDSPLHPQGIVAIATFTGNLTDSPSPWFTGPCAWGLDRVVILPDSVPCRGQQRLWQVPDVVLPEVRKGYAIAVSPCRNVEGAIAWFMANLDMLRRSLPIQVTGATVSSVEPLLRHVEERRIKGGSKLDEQYIRWPIERLYWALRK